MAPPKSHEVRIRIICTCLCYSDITFWKLQIVKNVQIANPKKAINVQNSPLKFLLGCIEMELADSLISMGIPYITFLMYQVLANTVVDITYITKVDAEIPPNKACLLSCGVSTGIGAAWKAADVEPGSTVVIFGLGVIGLGVAEGARIRGAKKIIGVDLNPEKFEIGKKFGITDFVNSKNCGSKSVSEVINEMTGGGADYCFECVGLPTLMQEAFSCCKKGWGKTIVLGVEQPGMELNLSSLVTAHSGKTLMGTLFGSLKPKTDIPMLAKSYMNKELQLDGFVTHEVKLEDINQAFDLLLGGKSLRCVIWMDK